jgi:hypothetical protein
MQLLFIVLIAGIAGYFFARSKYSKPVDDAAGKVAATSQDYANQTSRWTRGLFNRRSKADQLRAWAAGPGAPNFPDDFRTWLAGLTPQEADEFTKALDSYSSGLGYELDKLVKGELDTQPARLQAFTEAIVSYSQTYRKTRDARQEADKPADVPVDQPPAVDGKAPAEKAVSRRRSESGGASETSSTG